MNTQQGFSLIQMSAVVAVAGIVMVSMLPGGDSTSDAEKIQITKERMQAIETAMQSFIANNLRRPCPASRTEATTSANFGTEQITSGVCTSTAGTAEYVGMVPVKALNLGEEYAFDAYGRRLEYRVDQRATLGGAVELDDTADSCSDLQNAGQKGAIEILSTAADTVPTDNVMWALISRGKDKYGSYSVQGSGPLAGASDADTLANIAATGVLVKKEPTSTFDDIVWYSEPTKNTCCKGKACNLGFKVAMEATTTTGVYVVSLATGDINGDGIKDMVIGNYAQTPQVVYVVLGSKTGWPVGRALNLNDITQDASAPYRGMVIQNDLTTDILYFGRTVATGDVNGDGYDDIIIGGMYRQVIVFGSATISDYKIKASELTGSNGIVIRYSVSAACCAVPKIGDINGDGYKDIVVGQTPAHTILYFIYGRADWTGLGAVGPPRTWDIYTDWPLAKAPDANGFRNAGANNASIFLPTATFGNVTLGDINNDGYDDYVMSHSTQNYAGILFGRSTANWGTNTFTMAQQMEAVIITNPPFATANTCTSGALSVPTCRALRFTSTAGGSSLSHAMAVADINGDGYKDALFMDSVNIYLYSGSTGNGFTNINVITSDLLLNSYPEIDLNSNAVKINISNNKPSWITFTFNTTIMTTGDINGDGKKDIIVSAYGANPCSRGANTGSIYVIMQPSGGWGSADMFDDSSADGCNDMDEINTSAFPDSFRIDGPVAGDYAFIPVVADLNADGKEDILIGGPGNGGTRRGYVYVVWGRRTVPWDLVDLSYINDDDAADALDLTDLP